MEKVIYKEKGFEIKNPSPFLVTILKMKKQREERQRVKDNKTINDFALKIDREIMRDLV